jgi:hypothetical protein
LLIKNFTHFFAKINKIKEINKKNIHNYFFQTFELVSSANATLRVYLTIKIKIFLGNYASFCVKPLIDFILFAEKWVAKNVPISHSISATQYAILFFCT